MGFLVRNAVLQIDNAEAAQIVSDFADQYAPNSQTSLLQTFYKIAHATSLKMKWAHSADEQTTIKANLIAVLGAQFKPLKNKHTPQLSSMSLLCSLNGFCQVRCDQKMIKHFLDLWAKASSEKQPWQVQDTVDFANCVRALRQSLERSIAADGDRDVQQAKILQAHLCYVEAGFYMSSRIKLESGQYVQGPREALASNSIRDGFFVFERSASPKEKADETLAREVAHDILLRGFFEQEASCFSVLGLKPLVSVRADPVQSVAALAECMHKALRNPNSYAQKIDDALRRLQRLEKKLYVNAHGADLSSLDEVSTLSTDGESTDVDDSSIASGDDLLNSQHDSSLVTQQAERQSKNLRSVIVGFLKALGDYCHQTLVFLSAAFAKLWQRRQSVFETTHTQSVPGAGVEISRPKVQKMHSKHEGEQRMYQAIAHIDSGVRRWMRVLKESKQLKALQRTMPNPEKDIDDDIHEKHMSRREQNEAIKRGLSKYLHLEEQLFEQKEQPLTADMLVQMVNINRNIDHALHTLSKQSRFLTLQHAKHYVLGASSKKQLLQQQLHSLTVKTCLRQKEMIVQLTSKQCQKWNLPLKKEQNLLRWLNAQYGLSKCDNVDTLNCAILELKNIERLQANPNDVAAKNLPTDVESFKRYLEKNASLGSQTNHKPRPGSKR